MTAPTTPDLRPDRPLSAVVAVVIAFVVLLGLPFGSALLVPYSSSGPPPSGGAAVYLNVTTMASLSFVPDQIYAPPGSFVHLIVTQDSTFAHTFTLSPTANFSFPSSDSTSELNAYFSMHLPMVNLSIAPVPGDRFFTNFTAPTGGSFEFVCLSEGHFGSGMHGTFTAGSAPSSSASSSGSTVLYALIAAIVVVVVIGAAGLLLRRRRRRPPSTPETPPTHPSPP